MTLVKTCFIILIFERASNMLIFVRARERSKRKRSPATPRHCMLIYSFDASCKGTLKGQFINHQVSLQIYITSFKFKRPVTNTSNTTSKGKYMHILGVPSQRDLG